MFRLKWLVILVLFLIAVQPSFADDRAKLVGLWRTVSFETEYQKSSEREAALGKNPTGYIMYTSEGRMWSIVTGEGREAPKTDEDRAALFKSMFAYTGMYRIEGDKLITKVDVSWNPAWVGKDQVRFFKIDGDRLQLISDWMQPVVKPERGMGRGIVTLERVK
jgi:Lipocalin-like domain